MMAFHWSLVISVLSFVAVVYLLHYSHYLLTIRNELDGLLEHLWLWILIPIFSATGYICYDFYSKNTTPNHTIRTSIDHYIAISSLSWIGWYMRRKLEKSTKNVKQSQDELLLKRLKDNVDTLYGRKYKFGNIKNRDDFVIAHPLTSISHYEPYIQKMLQTENCENILTAKKPIQFAVTSGTSGKSSILPMTSEQRIAFFTNGIAIVYDSLLQAYPESKQIQKSLKFFYTPRWRESDGGLPIGPNSSSPTNSKQVLSIYSTPRPGFEILSEPEALYIHLLFGLKDKYIGMLEANFSSIILIAFRALELQYESIINDIELGIVKPDLKISDDVRDELNKLLNPDKKRANELREAFKGGVSGLARRIWPECHLVLSADTGVFSLPASILQDTYCKGIPIYSPLYAASEGLLGVNIWPQDKPSKYMLVPGYMFFEFIPVENCEEHQPKTLFMDQIELGKEYELVITNAGGLYRYRFGDVVKIAGFHNQCPVIEFMYRQGQFLNVRGEKTSEKTFYNVLMEASNKWEDTKVFDYCCAESVLINEKGGKDYAPFYHVFLEFNSEYGDMLLTEDQKNEIDNILCNMSYVYGSFRKKGSIQKMMVYTVKPGTFQGLRQFAIETTTASANQYKIPRVVKTREAAAFMMKNVIQ